jgi:disease resistance protein RPM1
MEALDSDASKSLFVRRTFGNKGCPTELEDVMGKILKRCAGLPLAIVSIASVLAAYTSPGSIEKWESVYRSIGSQMESHPTLEGMRQIVTLSYNHLPHELKSCMMYLSIFPEDYEIEKYRLLCRWIAEGLVMEKRGFTPMEVAESYLDELVSRNMIQLQVSFGYYWTLETCRVHDMLLEVMGSKSLECNFVSQIGGQYAGMSYDRIRRLSIQGDNSRRQSSSVEGAKKNMAGRRRRRHDNNGIEGMNVQHVRSLSIFHQKGQQQLLDHLVKFTLMRVLDLEGCVGLTKDHLQCICRLYLLRFLSFKGTDIKEVPRQIEKLEHLQTLDVRDTLSGCRLPETVKKLHQLERLQTSHNSDANRMWRLPLGLRNMTKLREVGFSVLGNNLEVAREVGELEHLQELAVYVEDMVDFDKEVLPQFAQSLSKSHSLRRLIIGEMGFGYILSLFLDTMDPPPRFLRYLMIAGGINHLPPWIGKLTYLVQINISWARLDGDKLFDGLCECPNLKIITILQRCYDGPELVARTKHKFPALANLRVSCGSKYPDIIRFEKGSMENLQTLLLNMTDNEHKRIEGIEHLANIKEVQLWGNKNNTAIDRALEELKNENLKHHANKQFQIVVKYE